MNNIVNKAKGIMENLFNFPQIDRDHLNGENIKTVKNADQILEVLGITVTAHEKASNIND